LFSGSVTSIIKGVYVFFSGNHRYIKVFKLLAHLGIRAYLAVLFRGLYYYNLSLLERPFYLSATAFYKVFIEFLLSYHKILREK